MLTIRYAFQQDNQQARELVSRSLGDYALAVGFDGLDRAIGMPDNGNAIELIAQWKGQLCGCIALQTLSTALPGKSGKLFGFHVSHGVCAKGIGRSLLNTMMGTAQQQGYQSLQLDTWDNMRAAIRLYESLGWLREPDPPPESGANRSYLIELSNYSIITPYTFDHL